MLFSTIFTVLFCPYIAHERTAHNLDYVSLLVTLPSFSYWAPSLPKSRFAQERRAIERFKRAMRPALQCCAAVPPPATCLYGLSWWAVTRIPPLMSVWSPPGWCGHFFYMGTMCQNQTWALTLFFQVCSPLIFYPWIAIAHFAYFQVCSLLNRSKKNQ